MQLTFIILTLYLKTLLIFLRLVSVDSLVFSTHSIMSYENKNSFTSFFPLYMPLPLVP